MKRDRSARLYMNAHGVSEVEFKDENGERTVRQFLSHVDAMRAMVKEFPGLLVKQEPTERLGVADYTGAARVEP